MTAEQRRSRISARLHEAHQPISATALAKELGVSRQIIVGDIALLRAGGAEISATPRGYLLHRDAAGLVRTVACVHTGEQTEQELCIMVDNGCVVQDVVVEHPIYGQIAGQLQIASRYDVSQFIQRLQTDGGAPLSALTDGIHLHSLSCPDEASYEHLKARLRELGFLAE